MTRAHEILLGVFKNTETAWELVATGAFALALAAACASKSEPAPTPSPATTTCDAAAESAELLARLAERPMFANVLSEMTGNDLAVGSSPSRADLVEWHGASPMGTVKWVLRITPRGWIALPTDRVLGQPLETGIPLGSDTSAHRVGNMLRSELPKELVDEVAIAADADTPRWLVDLSIAVLARRGASETMLLFSPPKPIPQAMRIPRGFGPNDDMSALDPLFEKHRPICPKAHAAFANGVSRASFEAMAKAVAECPCETDFALMAGVTSMAEGSMPLSAQVVRLEQVGQFANFDQLSEREQIAQLDLVDELDSEWKLRTQPWSEDHADLIAKAKSGVVRAPMPPEPSSSLPPPPPLPGKKKR